MRRVTSPKLLNRSLAVTLCCRPSTSARPVFRASGLPLEMTVPVAYERLHGVWVALESFWFEGLASTLTRRFRKGASV